jgi:hypothetical protein
LFAVIPRGRHEMRQAEESYRAPAARIDEIDEKAAIRFALVAAFKGARGSLTCENVNN